MTDSYETKRDAAALGYAKERTKDRTYYDGNDEVMMLLGFKAGADWSREELLSYLPKIPTQPYEKAMAKEIVELKAKLDIAKAEYESLKESLILAKKQRDRYALAMAEALRRGIYADKQAVKEDIERILELSPPTDPDDGWEQNMGG